MHRHRTSLSIGLGINSQLVGRTAGGPPAGIYIATDGDDGTGDGSFDNPYASLQYVHDSVLSDNTGAQIWVRGGTYDIDTEFGIFWTKNGAGDGDRIKIFAYPDETPVFDYTNLTCASDSYPGSSNAGGDGVFIKSADYTHWKGIHFKKAHLVGFEIYGWGGNAATYHKIEQCIFSECGIDGSVGYGFATYEGGHHIEVINCDSYLNYNSIGAGTNADGFQFANTGTGGGNIARGNRAWLNGDDGFDVFALFTGQNNDAWLIDQCWSWQNGFQSDGTTPSSGDGNGFKMGGATGGANNGAHTWQNCLAFGNRVDGFDENDADVAQTVYNCTSFNNGERNYDFLASSSSSVLKNNVSHEYAIADNVVGASTSRYNNWDLGISATTADFVSVATTGVDGAREEDGSLPIINLMKLTSTSKLVDAGVDVGIDYNSTAPDLGAFESAHVAPTTTFVRTMYVGEQTSLSEFTATSARWQTGAGASFLPDASTDYFAIWSAEVANPAITNGDVQYRVFDGSSALASGNIEPKDTDPVEWLAVGGVCKFTSGGSPSFTTLSIQIKPENNTHECHVRNASIVVIKRIATDQYVETAAATSGIGTSETEVQNLTWTPDSTRDYLVIGSAGVGPGASPPSETQLRLKQGATERARNYHGESDNTNSQQAIVVHYAAGLTAVSQTFTLAGIHTSATNLATFKERNLLALDVTGMVFYQNSATAVDGSTSNTQSYVDSYSNSPTIAATKKHLAIVSSGMRHNSTSISAYGNVTIDGVQVAEIVRESSNVNHNTGMSMVWHGQIASGSRAIAQQVKNESGTGNAQIFQAKQVVWQIEA